LIVLTCNFPQPPINSYLLGPNILLSTPIYILSLILETTCKFHTHTKLEAKLQFCIC
jgi:hypothetical protein